MGYWGTSGNSAASVWRRALSPVKMRSRLVSSAFEEQRAQIVGRAGKLPSGTGKRMLHFD